MARKSRLVELGRLGKRLDGVFVFDAHQHLGPWHPFHIPVTDAAGAVAVMDRIGIDGACTSSIAAVLGGDVQRGNDEVIAAVRAYSGRIFGYIAVSPADPRAGTGEEVERCARAGLRAIKIHSYQGIAYDADEYRPAYEIADEGGWPILAHSGGPELDVIDKLAETYPGAKWLVAHSGASGAEKYCDVSRRRDNVFLETCSSPSTYDNIESLVRGAGAEKVLYGSDMVFLNATQQIGKILFARIPDADKELILGRNARQVFNLPTGG